MGTTRLQRSLAASAILLAATISWRAAGDAHLRAPLGLTPTLLHGLWLVAAAGAYAYIAAMVARARKAGEPFSIGWLVPATVLGAFLPVLGLSLVGLLLAH